MRLACGFCLALVAARPAHAESHGVPGVAMSAAPGQTVPLLPAYDPNGPRIEYRAVLTAGMEHALKAYDPEFKAWSQSDYPPKDIQGYPFSIQSTPSAAIGDFNGDGRLDCALAGRNGHGPELLAIISRAEGHSVVPIYRRDTFDALRKHGKRVPRTAFGLLSLAPKGKTYDAGGDMAVRLVTLRNDGFVDRQLNEYSFDWWYGLNLSWWESSDSAFHREGVDLVAARPAHARSHGVPGATMAAAPKRAAPALPAYAPGGPRIEFGVSLPPAIEQAVRKVAPGFKIWRQTDYPPETIRRYGFSLQSTPSAVLGDFNGDGILDSVLAGRDRDGPMALVILSHGNSYHASLLYPKEPFRGWRAKHVQGKPLPPEAFDLLTLAPKGSTYDLGGDMDTKLFALPQEGFTDRPLDVYTLKHWNSPKLYWWDSAASKVRSGEVFEDR